MPHVDQETLALWALGEGAGAGKDHLAGCADCRDSLTQLRELVATARQDGAPVELVPPPPALWDRIAAATAAPGSGPAADTVPAQAPTPPAEPAEAAVAAVAAAAAARRRPARSWSTRARLAVAAAAGIVIGAGAAVGIGQLTGGSTPATASAQGALRPLPQFPQWRDASGTAEMRLSSDARVMQVTLDAPAESGFYEVWLLGRDGVSMISLGDLPASHTGSFAIPAGADLRFYSRVDVSLQPFDGSPVHSKASVVRGNVPAVS